MSLVLFPYLLGHVCNLPFSQVDVTQQTRPLLDGLHALLNNEEQRQAHRAALVDDLLPYIEQITDRPVHQRLYSIRRDIYNDRSLRPAEQTFALAMLPPSLANRVADWADSLQQQRTLTTCFEDDYTQLSYALRQQLQQRVDHEPFKKALVFASHSLLESIQRYHEKAVAAFHSKEFGLETTLLKYYTRMATKASPFSQFTSIFWIDLHTAGTDSAQTAIRSVVQPNRTVLGQLQLVLSLDEQTCSYFNLYLNPTLAINEQEIHFLTNRGNTDSHHHLPISPEITHLRTALKTGPQAYRTLHTLLIAQTGHDESAADALLHHYLNLGLLEVDFGLDPANPDWIEALSQYLLKTLPADNLLGTTIQTALSSFMTVQHLLRDGVATARQFAQEQAASALNNLRIGIRAHATGQVAQTLSHHAGFLSIQPHQLFFEDTYRSGLPVSICNGALETIANSLQQLMASHAYFDENALPRHRLYEAYLRHFGTTTQPVLTAYEHYRTHNNWINEASAQEVSTATTVVQRTRQAYQQWLDCLCQQVVCVDGTLTLRSDDLHYAAQKAGLPPNIDLGAASAFVQLLTDSDTGTQLAVLNSIHAGFGKMSSRFLHQLPVSITAQLSQQNASMPTNALRCELDDATHSNANVHPCLLPYRLTLAGHQQAHRPADLLVRDLAFQPDPVHQRLQLIHVPTQRPVELYDLGTVLANFRSPLFAFLSLFTVGNKLNLQPFLKGFYRSFIQSEGISALPRLVLDGQVVVQRRAWHVPQINLPSSPSGQAAATFFRNVNQWRLAAGMPRRVFVFVQSKFMYHPSDLRNLSRDDTKPQFIDFDDPILVGLFGKLLNKVKTALLIEEMLPDAPDLIPIDGEGVVCEYLLQWYNNAPQTLPDHVI